jgi:hypothetical protein
VIDDDEAAIKAGQLNPATPTEGLKKVMAQVHNERFDAGLMPVSEAIHIAGEHLFAPFDALWSRYRPIRPCSCGVDGCLKVTREFGGVLSANKFARMAEMTTALKAKYTLEHTFESTLITRTATWKCKEKKLKIKTLLVKVTVIDQVFHREYML